MENNFSQTRNSNQQVIKGETIRELAHRHMLNKNHTTTDEELKNARIEFSNSYDTSYTDLALLSEVDNTTIFPPLNFEKNITLSGNQDQDQKKDKTSPPNPYDILR